MRPSSLQAPPCWPPPYAAGAFNGLFLGLGAVALLVGAVGVANIMVISVITPDPQKSR